MSYAPTACLGCVLLTGCMAGWLAACAAKLTAPVNCFNGGIGNATLTKLQKKKKKKHEHFMHADE